MKLGVICDGISRDLKHAVDVMDEFGLEYAELQFVGDKEVGDHSAQEIREALEGIRRLVIPEEVAGTKVFGSGTWFGDLGMAATLISLLAGIAIVAWRWWWWRTQEFLVTNFRLVLAWGVINKSASDSSLWLSRSWSKVTTCSRYALVETRYLSS